ncbi:hypothetical protein A0H81_03452 [Grifola frondosa]|uniref:DUF6534 domain-containing protein n=1 Tax=Grifola frondosa TaxID=5627 RepID=A0A1C7MI25_GRIFR|nr:hypothetical protein A0H81_03452 [Grifola frondosa]
MLFLARTRCDFPPTKPTQESFTMPSPIKLDNTLGAMFLGNIFAAVFYGITNVQTFSYYKRNGKDPQSMKIMIFFLWILDGLHLALITDALYTYTVRDFTDLLAISVPTRSIVVHIIVEGITILIIRSFFCYRIWRLGQRSWAVVIAIVVLSLIEFGTNIGKSVSQHGRFGTNEFHSNSGHRRMASLPHSQHSFRGILNTPHSSKVSSYFQLTKSAWILYLGLSAALAADVIVAVSLCWLLAKHRTGFKRTDSIIRVLMLYSINTCVLTIIFAFCCLITFITMPDSLIFLGFYFTLPKLYLNSFLATLNSRKHVREIGSSTPVMSIPLSAMSGTRTAAASADGTGAKSQYEDQVLQTQIQTTTDMKWDSATPIV